MARDYKIYIDTTKREQNKLIFYQDGKIVELVEGVLDVAFEIRKLLKKHGVEISEVFFDYNQGPGDSFTGLKVACVVTNVLNLANNKISSLQVKLPNYGKEPNISLRKS